MRTFFRENGNIFIFFKNKKAGSIINAGFDVN